MTQEKRKIKVLLIGYFGAGNFGDEMLLKAAVNILKHQSGCALRVLSQKRQKKGRTFPGEKPVKRSSFFSVLSAILWADVLLSPGGNLLQDESSFASLLYYTALFRMGKIFGKKTVFLSSGFGEFSLPRSGEIAAAVLKRADLIGARSAGDLQTAFSLRKNSKSVIRMPDECYMLNNIYKKRDIGCFALIYGKIDFCTEAEITALQSMTGLSVKRILFHERQDLPQGAASTDFIIPKTPAALLDALADAAFVLSGRYHGAVFSLLAGIPCFLTDRSEKCRRFLTDHPRFCFPYPSGGISRERLRSFLSSYSSRDAEKQVAAYRRQIADGWEAFFRLFSPPRSK